MYRWRSEAGLLTRYLGSGVLNTIAGFSVIILLMSAGLSPVLSNIGGYVVGFVLGFMVSKKFVFRSNGHFVSESIRYLAAFMICFLINLLVLHLALAEHHWSPLFAQILAGFAYTSSMYGLTRYFVFQDESKK